MPSSSVLAQRFKQIFPVLLFVVAFIPRVLQQITIFALWHTRARLFMEAIKNQDWTSTFQSPHPGVTTMWLAGIAQEIGGLLDSDFATRSTNQQMAIELIPISLVIAISIVIAYFLLRDVLDWQIAAVATLLLALDPYHISLSQAIHVDALVSIFALLSALFMWSYIKQHRSLLLVFSGIFAGFALLTKTPSLFLFPYFLLVIFTGLLIESHSEFDRLSILDRQRLILTIKRLVFAFLIWFATLTATYFILWPSMWIQPIQTLSKSLIGTNSFRTTPHPFPIFFFGQAIGTDPGVLFYPLNMAFKTTAVVSIGLLLSLFMLLDRKLRRNQRIIIFFALTFLVFFTIMMTLGDKKFSRYALPALQFSTLLAGFGIVLFLRKYTKDNPIIFTLVILLVILVQAGVSLARFPNFGTHYNYLFGGPKPILESEIIAGQEKIEGLEIAADYLNTIPLAQLMVVGAQDSGSLFRYYDGKTVDISDENVDYFLFTRNALLKEVNLSDWQKIWEKYRTRDPKYTVEFDGIPYVWIYKTGPEISENSYPYPANAMIGNDIHLLGYDYKPIQAKPGDTVQVTLYWEALNKPAGDYTVFTHLLDTQGQLVGQSDSQPQSGKYPTYLWDQNERIMDQYQMVIPMETPPGNYELSVGMYSLETLERLPIIDSSGIRWPDGRLQLNSLEIVAGE